MDLSLLTSEQTPEHGMETHRRRNSTVNPLQENDAHVFSLGLTGANPFAVPWFWIVLNSPRWITVCLVHIKRPSVQHRSTCDWSGAYVPCCSTGNIFFSWYRKACVTKNQSWWNIMSLKDFYWCCEVINKTVTFLLTLVIQSHQVVVTSAHSNSQSIFHYSLWRARVYYHNILLIVHLSIHTLIMSLQAQGGVVQMAERSLRKPSLHFRDQLRQDSLDWCLIYKSCFRYMFVIMWNGSYLKKITF